MGKKIELNMTWPTSDMLAQTFAVSEGISSIDRRWIIRYIDI